MIRVKRNPDAEDEPEGLTRLIVDEKQYLFCEQEGEEGAKSDFSLCSENVDYNVLIEPARPGVCECGLPVELRFAGGNWSREHTRLY